MQDILLPFGFLTFHNPLRYLFVHYENERTDTGILICISFLPVFLFETDPNFPSDPDPNINKIFADADSDTYYRTEQKKCESLTQNLKTLINFFSAYIAERESIEFP